MWHYVICYDILQNTIWHNMVHYYDNDNNVDYDNDYKDNIINNKNDDNNCYDDDNDYNNKNDNNNNGYDNKPIRPVLDVRYSH